MTTIETIWKKLKVYEGQDFKTKTGLPFTYEISGDTFIPSRTNYNISKSEFAKVLDMVPFKGPGEINQLVRGPTYIWAVLHDPRI